MGGGTDVIRLDARLPLLPHLSRTFFSHAFRLIVSCLSLFRLCASRLSASMLAAVRRSPGTRRPVQSTKGRMWLRTRHRGDNGTGVIPGPTTTDDPAGLRCIALPIFGNVWWFARG